MLDFVLGQHRRDLGGFEVARLLPQVRARHVGPFVFFDEMGPVTFPPDIGREVDVRPHPHIGLSTLTYLFAGEIMHRDSVGSAQPVVPGEVNWMTAGSGITHSERFEYARAHAGGLTHGIQAWIALPDGEEETAPGFAHHAASELPTIESDGAWVRLLAGEAFGAKAPVRTHSPLFYAHARLDAGARLDLPADAAERGAYVVDGEVEVDGRAFTAGCMLVFEPGEAVVAARASTTLMLLGGESVGPRHLEWNFVSSSRERIEQAKDDWRAGRMRLPDLDDAEFIPLPKDPTPAPNPMS